MKKITPTAPVIRFRGFTDVWEQRKLNNVADVRDGTHDSPRYRTEGHPFITSKNIKDGFINYADIQYISDEDFNEINKRSKVEVNNILMGMIGTIGNMALVREKPDYAIKNVALIKDTKKVHYLYLYHFLHSNNVVMQLFSGIDGGTQKFVSLNNIRNLNILFPNLKEQVKLGSFFEKIDYDITLYQRKLEQQKKLKKYFLQNMFPEEGETVPRIRFKEFAGDWEQRKLGDCFWSLPNNTLSRAELSYENGVVMNVHYGDVLIKFDEYLDVSKERLPFIEKQSAAEKIKTSYLKNGDVIVADTAEDETVGKCTEIIGLTDQKVTSGLHTIPLRPKEQFATGYLGFYLNSAVYHNQLIPLIQGTKVSSISKGAMQKTVIKYPANLEEQELIGQYFMKFDNLITLHQRKIDQLQNVKKFMLQNLFV